MNTSTYETCEIKPTTQTWHLCHFIQSSSPMYGRHVSALKLRECLPTKTGCCPPPLEMLLISAQMLRQQCKGGIQNSVCCIHSPACEVGKLGSDERRLVVYSSTWFFFEAAPERLLVACPVKLVA